GPRGDRTLRRCAGWRSCCGADVRSRRSRRPTRAARQARVARPRDARARSPSRASAPRIRYPPGMRRMLKDYGAVALLLMAVLVLFGRRPGRPDAQATAPEISVPDLQGATVQLADLAGTPVVLNFWA